MTVAPNVPFAILICDGRDIPVPVVIHWTLWMWYRSDILNGLDYCFCILRIAQSIFHLGAWCYLAHANVHSNFQVKAGLHFSHISVNLLALPGPDISEQIKEIVEWQELIYRSWGKRILPSGYTKYIRNVLIRLRETVVKAYQTQKRSSGEFWQEVNTVIKWQSDSTLRDCKNDLFHKEGKISCTGAHHFEKRTLLLCYEGRPFRIFPAILPAQTHLFQQASRCTF